MFHWKKKGLVFDVSKYRNGSWLDSFAQAPTCLVFDDFVRIYFSCRAAPDTAGQFISYTAYVDFDRADLTKVLRVSSEPILPLGGLGCFDQFGIYPSSVIRKGAEFWAYYAGHTRCESVPFDTAIGLATSQDGKTFNRAGPGPVLSYSPDEPFVISGPKIRKYGDTYYMWYITGKEWIEADGKKEVIYKIRMAHSADGLNWTKHNRDILPDQLGADETQASPDVIFAGGRYHMFFCYKYATGFRQDPARAYRIGYATSDNLYDWTRADDLAGLAVSPTGWDSEMVAYPHLQQIDGKTYLWYLGNGVGKHGFGLAELEGDFPS